MNKLKTTLFLVAIGYSSFGLAQGDLYATDTIREIRIYFNESNWDYVLDSLYVEGSGSRLTGDVEIEGVYLDSVGIRYKGYSSVSTTRLKNPFNIDLDYIINGQDYQGYDKIKLSNVIQDPSFLREIMSYEIARKYMPASKANFVNLYINDTLLGLYTNVEAVNKEFLSNHYGSRNNTFFKGNPATLDLNGENANLSNSPGADSVNYYPFYNLKSDFGWTDLYNFIDTLNNHVSSLENQLNVDQTLWMHAFNYSLINFDSYVGYAQNYYLYQDDNSLFNPILWDLNMSFASYRLTDDSDFWSGFSIAEAIVSDPLAHFNSVSVYPRPLMRNVFNSERYRRMYMAHIRTIMEENIVNASYYNRGLELQALADSSVMNDTNKFYSYSDFQNNLTNMVTDLIDYPGLTQLMDARAVYLQTLPGYQGFPTLDTIDIVGPHIVGSNLAITLKVADADTVLLAYRFADRSVFEKLQMYDDGMHGDGIAGDSVYGATIPEVANTIQYYFYAENDSAGKFAPVRAAYEYYTLKTQIAPQDLVVNEFMASNVLSVTDQNGEYDDWIELYNNTTAVISTSGLYLTDTLGMLTKWPLPSVIINPGDYFMIWADKDSDQEGNHANFKLSGSGEFLALSYADETIIDSVSYGSQFDDFTTGRYPNGTGPFQFLYPTFSYTNSITAINESERIAIRLYPNPTKDLLIIATEQPVEIKTVRISTLLGDAVIFENLPASNQIDISSLADGIYVIQLYSDRQIGAKKFIVTK